MWLDPNESNVFIMRVYTMICSNQREKIMRQSDEIGVYCVSDIVRGSQAAAGVAWFSQSQHKVCVCVRRGQRWPWMDDSLLMSL